MNEINIMNDIWDLVENEIEEKNTKISKKVYSQLDEERIFGAYLNGNIYWFESNIYGEHLTNDCYDWLKKKINKKFGYIHLHDIVIKK